MEIKNLTDAITFDIEGIAKYMDEDQRKKFDLVIPVYKKIVEIKEGKRQPDIYIHLWEDKESVEKALLGKVFLNSQKRLVRIDKIGKDRYTKEDAYFVEEARFVNNPNKKDYFPIKFDTIHRDFKFNNLSDIQRIKMERYFMEVNKGNADKLISIIIEPFNKIFDLYNKEKYNVLKSNNLLHTQNIKGDRQAKRIKRDPLARIKYEQSKQDVINAFNSYLTKDEKNVLMTWLNQHVNTLRLYVLKDGVYDQLLTKEFPDEQYGVKCRTLPNDSEEGSLDGCNGYVGVDSLEDCPIELFQRIARKKDSKDVFKLQGNQYRFNSYGFVLYLLSEFNDIGYITGISNLKHRIKMD